MKCPKHGPECAHFPKLMAAYAERGKMRERAEAAEAEVTRLRLLLARVGTRETVAQEEAA